ncbi:MAG TPA: hypothetical protein VNF91_11215, partial [Candidatus Acidoferrum sp.]|nr:hypothetical protein [Candidatus Acidoferrum sp.]
MADGLSPNERAHGEELVHAGSNKAGYAVLKEAYKGFPGDRGMVGDVGLAQRALRQSPVRKAKGTGQSEGLLVSYRKGRPDFALDPADLQTKGAVDEAVIDANGVAIGFC